VYEGKPMNANLVLLNKGGSHKTFALPNPVTILGRRHDCDLRIPLPMVSRRHCQLSENGASLKLRDLGSRSGTFVNDKRVQAEKDIPVKPGDYIRIGPLTFVCQIDGRPAEIVPPKKKKSAPQVAQAKPKPQKKAVPAVADDDLGAELDKELDEKLGDELDDLDVSDSFMNLDDLDADLEDLKDA
jgi:pSer/pThr/pTyr-binding forkhead associated (FHA) protein